MDALSLVAAVRASPSLPLCRGRHGAMLGMAGAHILLICDKKSLIVEKTCDMILGEVIPMRGKFALHTLGLKTLRLLGGLVILTLLSIAVLLLLAALLWGVYACAFQAVSVVPWLLIAGLLLGAATLCWFGSCLAGFWETLGEKSNG